MYIGMHVATCIHICKYILMSSEVLKQLMQSSPVQSVLILQEVLYHFKHNDQLETTRPGIEARRTARARTYVPTNTARTYIRIETGRAGKRVRPRPQLQPESTRPTNRPCKYSGAGPLKMEILQPGEDNRAGSINQYNHSRGGYIIYKAVLYSYNPLNFLYLYVCM